MVRLKHFLALIVFSIIALFLKSLLAKFLHLLGAFHQWLAHVLALLFTWSSFGGTISQILALTFAPMIAALIPAFIYWLIKRCEMPYLYLVTWIIWVMLATLLALG